MKTALQQIADDSDIVRVKMPFPPTLKRGSKWQVIRAVPVMSKQDKLLWRNWQLINIDTGKRISVSEEVLIKNFSRAARIIADRRFVRMATEGRAA
jgi:hypothetical protein